MEVVGITGITQVTTAKVLGIQNQRIAQCRYAKLTIHGQDTVPMQVDGEAWLQEPGIIVVSHKNKARIIFKDKVGWKHILLPQMMISGPWNEDTSLNRTLCNSYTHLSNVDI